MWKNDEMGPRAIDAALIEIVGRLARLVNVSSLTFNF